MHAKKDRKGMNRTIIDLINERRDVFCRSVESPFSTGQDITVQAETLLDLDRERFSRIGRNFVIPEASELPHHLRVRFNKFLIEPLLNDGSVLLDRCRQQRKEIDELVVKWFEVRLQVDEMLRLAAIAEDEEAKLLGLPIAIAESELEAVKADENGVDGSADTLQTLRNDWDSNTRHLVYAKEGTDETNAFLTYGGRTGNPHGDGERGANYWAELNARNSVNIDRDSQRSFLDAQLLETLGRQRGLGERSKSATVEVERQRLLSEFQKRRNEVALIVALRRASAVIAEGGALNFREQIVSIYNRFALDLIGAWLRLSTVTEGLSDLYGYPSELFPATSEQGTIDFDLLLEWTQVTSNWLAAFQDEQQLVTWSFSLRGIQTKESFEEGLKRSQWRFRLTGEHFARRPFARMRAISLQVHTSKELGSWNFSITPPPRGILTRRDDSIELDQSHVGDLFLGRVGERTYAVLPEDNGSARLHNASPVGIGEGSSGEWTLSVLGDSTSGSSSADIEDIDIHITVACV